MPLYLYGFLIRRSLKWGISYQTKALPVDAVYLPLLAALYALTHALVWAFQRLGKMP